MRAALLKANGKIAFYCAHEIAKALFRLIAYSGLLSIARVMTPPLLCLRDTLTSRYPKEIHHDKSGPFMLISCRRQDDGAIARTTPQTHLMCLFRLL